VTAAAPLQTLLESLRQSRVLLGAQELEARQGKSLSSGLKALDQLLGGGFPIGKAVELVSRPGGATTALAWRVLAHSTSGGQLAALIDPADAFHPQNAAEAGIQLERLLWCRPQSLVETLRSADAILAAAAFPLVVIDLSRRPSRADPRSDPRARASSNPKQISNEAWVRLIRRAEAVRASLVILTGEGLSLSSFASMTLVPRPGKARFAGRGAGRTFEGLVAHVDLARNKLGLPSGSAEVSLASPRCFPLPGSGGPRGPGRAP
jgi:hypothetical protein